MNDLNCWEEKFESCVYSDKLLSKLFGLNEMATNKIKITEIKKAIFYVKKYHGNQKRLSGEPYYSHPLEVAFMIADHCFKTDILVTSILHDTLEDTALTKEMIEYIFDPVIADQVENLTRIKLNDNKVAYKISAAKTLELLCQQKNNELLLIKYFDRLHNMHTINAKTPEKISKIVDETLKCFISLEVYFESDKFRLLKTNNTILNLCYQQLSIKQPLQTIQNTFSEDNVQLPVPAFENEQFQN